MSITAYSIVTALGKSPEFFNFERKHLSRTNHKILSLNSTLDNDFEVNLLHRFENTTETDPQLGLTAAFTDTVMSAVDLILTKSANNVLSTDEDMTKVEFENQYPSYNFTFEGLIEDNNGSIFPQIVHISSATEQIVLYMYPAKFEVVYPNSNVDVIALFDDINDFATSNLATVNSKINELGYFPFADKFSEITENMPATRLEIIKHQWVNKSNLSETTDVPFALVCYGNPSTEDKDQAIRDFITEGSTISKTDKEIIFPTLFGSFGWNIFPYWDNVSQVLDRVIYKPYIKPDAMVDFIIDAVPNLNGLHVRDKWEYLPTTFQSLGLVCIPDEEEVASIGDLERSLDTYFLVSPTDPDFVQMDGAVQALVRTLFEALNIAETFPTASSVAGIDIETVGDLTYATFFSNGLRWRVLTKTSYENAKSKLN